MPKGKKYTSGKKYGMGGKGKKGRR